MITVPRWTGREVRALREAKRLSLRAFAELIGVSDRMISNWEARGEGIQPRSFNQAALDTVLASSPLDVHERFAHATGLLHQHQDESSHFAESRQIRHPVDGKLMALIEAGVYLSGTDNQPTWLSAYYIDVYPTTNADYARFIAATKYVAPQHWDKGRCPDDLLDHPVVFITWRDANAYAQWAKKSLPTAQQWEKAARGPKGNLYPWGDQPTASKCNTRESDIGTTTPVGRYHSGVSSYGAYDMCGNTWEWCSSPSEGDRFELKGSAFTSPFFRAMPANFNDAAADMLDDDTSFRCATPA